MPDDVTIKVAVTFKLIDGNPKDEDYVLDAFAATIGRQNGALGRALKFTVGGYEDESRYEVELVDDA